MFLIPGVKLLQLATMPYCPDLADLSDDARCFASLYDLEPGCCLVELCERSTGGPPIFEASQARGRYAGGRIYLSCWSSRARALTDLAHELGHVCAERLGYRGLELESYAWFVGSCLLLPEERVRHAFKLYNGHDFIRLARDVGCVESCAFLRIGEVTGRPVLLWRNNAQPIARGRDYGWPPLLDLVRALRQARPELEYHHITDEPGRYAFMSSHKHWITMAA